MLQNRRCAKQLARQGIQSILFPIQQRRPLLFFCIYPSSMPRVICSSYVPVYVHSPPLINSLFLTFQESGATFLTPILNPSLVKRSLQYTYLVLHVILHFVLEENITYLLTYTVLYTCRVPASNSDHCPCSVLQSNFEKVMIFYMMNNIIEVAELRK